ncbi:hypothetical protein [Ruania zhangjianzhongii]|uniref:hypothetical protein n=1 Tax=Ruania zhangjianzhongii TaxID=2603206 RepID=UPI0011CA98D2|nr:hypothetical protein [Ruania zhangjianzhongii]
MRRAGIGCGVAVLLLAVGCAGEDPEPPPSTPSSSQPSEPPEETTEPSPEPFDPASVDLGEQEWQYATAYQAPVAIELSDGAGTGELDQGEGRFELGEDDPLLLDMDEDGDEDVVASLSFSADLGGENFQWVSTTWFVWLNDGEQLTQLPYPLAGSGDCDTQVDSVTAADGGGVVIEEAQLGWQSSCAAGANIEVTRTVQVSTGEDGQPWLVQTEPFASWGGACPMMVEPGDRDGEVVVAPGLEPASPEVTPVIVDGADSWLSEEIDGWDFVTYLQDEDPNFVSYCGWTES